MVIGMPIKGFIKFYIVLIAFLFMFYSLYDLGLVREILLFFAISLLSPSFFRAALRLRGVKRGDTVLVSLSKKDGFGFFLQKITARALDSGRKNDIIAIELTPGKAEGKIVSCGGILLPPEVKIIHFPGDDGRKEIIVHP